MDNKQKEKKDIYQIGYLKHQERKKKSLTCTFGKSDFKKYSVKEQEIFFDILKSRCSQRAFNNEEITKKELDILDGAIRMSPSSCNRKAIKCKIIRDRKDKEILSGLLVGGTGWIYRGQIILLLLAQMEAYKNPVERDNMPYLDAGVVIQTAFLTGEALNLGVAYVNPHIREENRAFFKERFDIKDNELFCGAIILGKYDLKHSR